MITNNDEEDEDEDNKKDATSTTMVLLYYEEEKKKNGGLLIQCTASNPKWGKAAVAFQEWPSPLFLTSCDTDTPFSHSPSQHIDSTPEKMNFSTQ